jgi:CelD/BcsL family acetyltransferase involved in cellulose biosynthesis
MPLSDEHCTHSDWLVAERSPAVADAFVEALHHVRLEWDRYRVSQVLEGHPFGTLVVEAVRRRGMRHLVRPTSPSYFLSLPTTNAAYLAARSGKFRNHLKRVERKVGATATIVTIVDDPADERAFDRGYQMLLDVERSSWKEEYGTSITARGQAGFYRDMCRGALAGGHLHLQVMTIDRRPVAYNLGFVSNGQYTYLKTSFSCAHRLVGPATFLRARLIEDLIARGVKAVDFPGQPYEWEQQWTHELRWHTLLTVYSGTVRSRVLEVLERFRNHRPDRIARHIDPRAHCLPRTVYRQSTAAADGAFQDWPE